MKQISVIAATTLFTSSLMAYSSTPIAPVAGSYGASVYITNVDGDDCVDQMGESFAGVMNFAGLDGVKDTLQVPVLTFSDPAVILSRQTLTVTTGKGTPKLRGTFVWEGNTIKGKAFKYSGIFSAKVTEISSDSFIVDITENYAHCTEYSEIGLVLASSAQ